MLFQYAIKTNNADPDRTSPAADPRSGSAPLTLCEIYDCVQNTTADDEADSVDSDQKRLPKGVSDQGRQYLHSYTNRMKYNYFI